MTQIVESFLSSHHHIQIEFKHHMTQIVESSRFTRPSAALAVPPRASGTRISMAPPCGFWHDDLGEEHRRGRGTSGALDWGSRGAELRRRVEPNSATPRCT